MQNQIATVISLPRDDTFTMKQNSLYLDFHYYSL